jgi:hypothetical protein
VKHRAQRGRRAVARSCAAGSGLALAAMLATLATLGCRRDPNYCPEAPLNNCQLLPDGPPPCASSADCSAPTAVCDLAGSRTCVECTRAEPAACTGAEPICGDDLACRGCRAHTECPASSACLPSGACADPAQVAYVEPTTLGGSDNSTCTFAAPCTKVRRALDTGRRYLKLAGTIDEGETLVFEDRVVTVLAEPDAKLVRTANGLHVEVRGSSQLAIYDAEISGASGPQGIGISLPPGNTATLTLTRVKVTNNTGGGISASGGTLALTQSTISGNTGGGISASGGTLALTQSTISNNAGGGISASGGTLALTQSTISGNTGGGIFLKNAQFELTNNYVFRNGSAASAYGGILINDITTPERHRLDFNTISENQATGTNIPGVNCTTVSIPLVFENNIIYNNGTATQVLGENCSYRFSLIGPIGLAENPTGDPQFVSPALGQFQLRGTSPARDAADPAATLAVDFDGDARPQGPRRDLGADEVR